MVCEFVQLTNECTILSGSDVIQTLVQTELSLVDYYKRCISESSNVGISENALKSAWHLIDWLIFRVCQRV